MRATALLALFIFAKIAVIWGRDLEASLCTPLALVWQDVTFAICFGLIDWWLRRPAVGWSLYVLIALYATLNVPIARATSSPLTWPMFRAADLTLRDSIAHYATRNNVMLVACLLLAAVCLPLLTSRLVVRWRRLLTLLGAGIVAVGPVAASRVDTAGLDRNVVAALITTAFPRVAPHPHQGDWRTCRFEPAAVDDFSRLRGVARGSNVLLVVLESAAAQYLRIYGANEDPMPNLTGLAARGLTFENAYVAYPESIKGLFALLCSTSPAFDTTPENYEASDVPALPVLLRQAGYRTGLFHSGRFAYLGMDIIVRRSGFETSEDAGQISGEFESSFGVDESSTVNHILAWIDRPTDQRPFLAVYLPIAGHHPYDTPRRGPFPEREEIGRYRNALHYADQALGELLAGLEQRGLDRSTIVVVCGDHGQAFGQHSGNFGHTLFLFEENVHIPLVVSPPGWTTATRSRTVASVIDVGPTLLDLLGRSSPPEYEGQSLLAPRPAMALFFTDYSLPLVGLRDGRWKFIDQLDGHRPKLFDLSRDPGETVDLASSFPGRAATYRNILRQWCEAQRHRVMSQKLRQ